ncbi:XRE family transcriptional regulator [Streptomyces sp. NPDC000594]|uniref:XRE family transcriptional regulator n=1 Tax=Streptomyces sp. NPDC000594 TaxID=3154261 RepID=UPI00331A3FC1
MAKALKRTAGGEEPEPPVTVSDTGDAEADGGTAVTGYRGPAPRGDESPSSVSVSGTGNAIATDGGTAISGFINHLHVRELTVRPSGLREHGRQAEASPNPLFPRPTAGTASGGVADAAASLAREVRCRWQREESHRRVHDPFPLPVRYRSAPAGLMDRLENIQRLQPGAAPRDLDLSGDLRSVVDTYRKVDSRRLVIIGRVGSGKSVLAIKFALDHLAAPESAARVPVIFSIGSWDPITTTPRDFLIDRLLRDHPHLARRTPDGATLAAALVDAELILPVLDGFDELAEALRGPALEALNTTSLPLILTSRREAYARAIREGHAPLVWAACIELLDLNVEDLAAYLPRTDRFAASWGGCGDLRVWDSFLERLRVQHTPASIRLRQILGTPLMVALARTIYGTAPGKQPLELFDTTRFPTKGHIEEHLLAGFVPTLYQHRAHDQADTDRSRRNRDVKQAQRWLGYLASSLTHDGHDRQDIAWWRLGESVRLSTRILHTALGSALCMALATCLVGFCGYAFVHPFELRPTRVLMQGALAGLLFGITFGLAHGVLALSGRSAALPSRVRLKLSTAERRAGRGWTRDVLVRVRAALVAGAVLGIGTSWTDMLIRAADGSFPDSGFIRIVTGNMLLLGLVFSLTAGLAFGLLAVLEAPMDITAAATPVHLLSANRAAAIRQLLVLVPVITLGCALGGHIAVRLIPMVFPWTMTWPLSVAFFYGAIGGLGGSMSYVLAFTAWGQWLTLARVWMPLTRRLPWDTVAFLKDAYQLGVLRHTGAVYQFRHNRLQQHLAHSYRDPGQRTAAATPAEAPANPLKADDQESSALG